MVHKIIQYFSQQTDISKLLRILSWKSKGFSEETIKPAATSDNNLAPELGYYGTKTRVNFNGSCLKQPKLSDTHSTIVNIYIVYELGASSFYSDDPTFLGNTRKVSKLLKIIVYCLFFLPK